MPVWPSRPRLAALHATTLFIGTGLVAEAQTTSTYTPITGEISNWSDPVKWDTSAAPINGQPSPGDTYNAIVNVTHPLQLDVDVTIQDFTLSSGASLRDGDVRNTLTINGLFTYNASVSGESTLHALGGVQMNDASGRSLAVTGGPDEEYIPVLNAGGTSTWSAGNVTGQSVINNNGQHYSSFNLLAGATFDATIANGVFQPSFQVAGTANLDPGAGGVQTFRRMLNDGTVNVLSGTVELESSSGPLTSHGDFTVAADATLVLYNTVVSSAGSITGDGDVLVDFPSQALGTYDIGGTTTLGTGMTFGAAAHTGQLVIETFINDAFNGGTLTVSGASRWVEGGATGDLTINANGGMSFESVDESHALNGDLTLNLGGASTWSSTEPIRISDNARLHNTAAGTFTVIGDRQISFFSGQGEFSNAGTLHKTGGGALEVRVPSANTGLIVIDADNTIDFAPIASARLTMTDGEIRLNGGSVSGIDYQGGTLSGFGNAGSVTIDAATVSPGHAGQPGPNVGALEFFTLELTGDATTVIELAGVADDAYDRVLVDTFSAEPEDLTLGGVLEVRFAAGFEVSITPADEFTIFSFNGGAAALSGSFSNVAPGERLFTADGLGSFLVSYGPGSAFGTGSVVLSDFVAVPEPASLAVIAGGVPLVLVRRRRH